MDQHNQPPQGAVKPEWAMSRRDRKRKALREAGIEPGRFPWVVVVGIVLLGGAAAFVIPQFTSPKASTPAEAVEQSSAPVTKQLLAIDVATARVETLIEVL